MKKIIYTITIISLLLILVACGSKEQSTDTIVVTDANFISQMEMIYMHTDDYVGKKIELEGFVQDVNVEAKSFGILRKYNCCEDETSLIGLDCQYNHDLPKENDWIKVTGIIKKEYEGEEYYPSIQVETLQTKLIRGNELVYQE